MKIPTYSGMGENQCLPHAFAALTGGNGDYWSQRLGYDRPIVFWSWTDIARGIPPNWSLLYDRGLRHAHRVLLSETRARIVKILPRMRIPTYADLFPGDSVLVIWGRRGDRHAVALRNDQVFDPDGETIRHVSRYSRKLVLYAWHKS